MAPVNARVNVFLLLFSVTGLIVDSTEGTRSRSLVWPRICPEDKCKLLNTIYATIIINFIIIITGQSIHLSPSLSQSEKVKYWCSSV